jgi:putative molybdopterin biosynthesis protein
MADFLTTKEVAELLRIKERTVYDLVKEGSIPASRVTGKLLFPPRIGRGLGAPQRADEIRDR